MPLDGAEWGCQVLESRSAEYYGPKTICCNSTVCHMIINTLLSGFQVKPTVFNYYINMISVQHNIIPPSEELTFARLFHKSLRSYSCTSSNTELLLSGKPAQIGNPGASSKYKLPKIEKYQVFKNINFTLHAKPYAFSQ